MKIYNSSFEWSSGVMDITCATEVDLHAIIQSLGTFEATDYLNIYYKLDGGEKVAIVEVDDVVETQIVSATNLSGSTLEIIVESNVSGTSGLYYVKNLYVLESSDPFARIEAEDYDAKSGTSTEVCSDTDGGYNVGSISDGDWLMFSNINLSEVHSISARLSHKNSSEGTVEIRLNSETGTLIGTLNVPNTGNWQNWETVTAELDDVLGIYDVYLVFNHPSYYVCNINWLQFSSEVISDPTTVKETKEEQEVVCYPNPVDEYLVIENGANAIVEIFNNTGSKVLEAELQSDRETISMQGLAKGIYIIRVLNDGNTKTQKLIKL